MIRINNYTFDTFDEIIVNRYSDGAWLTTIEEPKGFSVENTAETKNITGKNDRVVKTLDKNKGCTIKGQSGLLSGGLLEAQIGSLPVDNEATALQVDIVTITDDNKTGGVVTTYSAVGAEGAEIGTIQKLTKNGVTYTEYKQGTTATATVFSYDPKTKKVTLPTDVVAGDVIRIAYNHKPTKSVAYTNNADIFSDRVQIIANCTVSDPCTDEKLHAQLIVHKAKMDGNFTLDFLADQVVHDFSAVAEYSLCAGASKDYWTLVVF